MVGFAGSFFSLRFNYGAVDIIINWALLFPLMIAMAWGKKFGLISIFFGLTVFSPFFLGRYNGWGCIATAAGLAALIAVQGWGRDKRSQARTFYTNIYFLQLVYIAIRLVLYFTAFPLLHRLNPPFWYPEANTSIAYGVIAVFALKSIIVEFVLLALSDILLLLPAVGRIFRIDYAEVSRYNTGIILLTFAVSMASSFVVLIFNYFILERQYDFQWLQSSSSKMTFFLAGILGLAFGRVIIQAFQARLKAQATILENITEKMKTDEEVKRLAASLSAIFESTRDSILLLDENYRLMTCNQAFRDNIKMYTGVEVVPGIKTGELAPNIRADLWESYYEKALRDGAFTVEETLGGVVIEVCFNPIFKDGKGAGVAIFCKDITRRKMAEQEILKLNTELEQRVAERTEELQIAVRELESFVYTVSHDLKSPLRAIDAYSRILIEDYPEQMKGETGEIAENIRSISRDMIALTNKLLQYSTAARLDLYRESVDLNKMINQIFHELASAIPQRQISLVMATNLPPVNADKVLLKQVIYNVISNAIKFTKTRDQAVIRAGHIFDQEEAVFYIQDNGVGFEQSSSEKLFGIFQRLHSQEEFEGTGIGLATVRKIIQKHGGRTWITGKPDQGATVYFTLSLR